MDQNPNSTDIPPPGATLDPSGVCYRVWAPQTKSVSVEILSPAGDLLRSVALPASGAGYFSGLDPSGAVGDRYKFRLGDAGSFPDPASRWQPDGVHGPSMVIDPSTYQWSDAHWQRPPFRDLVIYELHVGTFSLEGTFKSAIEKLHYIRECGANAIELMPIADFDGAHNWGYDGVCLFAPSRAYGHPDDLRALVDAAHSLGLTVILDVVYNHFGPSGNYLKCYIGDYLDETAKTPWGGAIRYGHPEFKPLRDWVVSNPGYWMREFHIDGFRLDATHAIIDESPRHILLELTAEIHHQGGFAIAEDARNDVRLMLPEKDGGFGFDAVWADDFHHIIRVANTHETEGYFGDFNGSLHELVDTIRNGWHYCGQVAASEGQPRGTECRQAPPQCFIHCISNHDQTGNHAFGERLAQRIHPAELRAAEALLCLSPGTPMIFMGQEWITTTPFLFFTDHDADLGELIMAGRREEFKFFEGFRDPALLEKLPHPQYEATFQNSKLKWEERDHPRHAGILELYKACLALRASEPAFRPLGRDSWIVEELGIGAGALRYYSTTADWLVIFDLRGGHQGSLWDEPICRSPGEAWSVVLFTSETRFGGSGHCPLNPATMQAVFHTPETVVLRATRAG